MFAWLKMQKLKPSLTEVLAVSTQLNKPNDKHEKYLSKMKQIASQYPDATPAYMFVAFHELLRAFGKLDEFFVKTDHGERGIFQTNITLIQDKNALSQAMDMMDRYFSIDPDLRWDCVVFPWEGGPEPFLEKLPELKKKTPLLLAQSEGLLDLDILKQHARNGNEYAATFLAERLSKTEKKNRWLLLRSPSCGGWGTQWAGCLGSLFSFWNSHCEK